MYVDLQESRRQIDEIDSQIVELFEKRMKFASELAQAKKEVGEPIYNKNREDKGNIFHVAQQNPLCRD